MAKVFQFIANGSEEIEALTVVDVLRRGGIDIKTVSVNCSDYVEMSHGVVMKCDTTIEDADLASADMLLLPGGMPGSTNLLNHKGVREALLAHAAKGGKLGAICAAPMVLGELGLLKGRKATCYPGFEKHLLGAKYTRELVTVDGDIITGEGPAATLPYAYAILGMFVSEEQVEALREGMMFNHLMNG